MATSIQEHHDRPAPGSADLYPDPFPPSVLHGLWISAVAGGVLGLIFGRLLVSGAIVIENWEQMYSVGSFTLTAFWTMIGIALGTILGGIGSTLLVSPAVHEDEDRDNHETQSRADTRGTAETEASTDRSQAKPE